MSTSARVERLSTVMVPVSDQDRGIEFYRDKLGFELRTDTPMGRGERWVEVAPPSGETTIALVLRERAKRSASTPGWPSGRETSTATMHG